MTVSHFEVERVRHPLKFRLLQVLSTRAVTPHLLSVVFTGDDLDDFVSASFDDHVKLFFPLPGEKEPVLPAGDPKAEGAPKTIARDFTPHRYDAARRELEIQFALHGTGPASTWAEQARPGDRLGLGGPRGSFLIPTGFDWFLMLGDPTAIPAITRRLAELPAATRVTVMLLADGPAEQFVLATRADADVRWLDRLANPQALEQAAAAFELPPGEGYIWAAGEGAAMRAVHEHFVGQRGFPKGRIRAASYWKPGAEAVHETMGQ